MKTQRKREYRRLSYDLEVQDRIPLLEQNIELLEARGCQREAARARVELQALIDQVNAALEVVGSGN